MADDTRTPVEGGEWKRVDVGPAELFDEDEAVRLRLRRDRWELRPNGSWGRAVREVDDG